MRPLNRPMFKYGGPIKEGIMTGMKEIPNGKMKVIKPGSLIVWIVSNEYPKTW